MGNFLARHKLTRVMNAVAAGTTDQNSSSVNMAGFEEVTFIAAFGVITGSAVTSIRVQTSSDDGSSDSWTDILGSDITVADDDDNQIVAVTIRKPLEQYLRCTVKRATQNAVIDGVIAIQSGAGTRATTHDSSSVVGTEIHVSPAEGTA